MEAAPEEVAMGIVKGKRTKRLRPKSPIPFAAIASNHEDGGGEFEGINIPNLSLSSSSSSELYRDHNSNDREEEEEVDMANCLILLAQGQSKEIPKLKADEDHDQYHHNYDTPGINNYNNKFSSRRFMEAASNGTGAKAGYYVYECKTCNRNFPSFQALGGHRASHKKPKATTSTAAAAAAAVDQKIRQFTAASAAASDESLSLQLSHNNNNINNNNRGLYMFNNNKANKVHECSICGAEFSSGQALGGHMRRHRGPISTNSASTTLALAVPIAMEHNKKPRNNVLSLDLDLNLPAPEDDHHHRESNFPFASKQQQKQPQQQSPLVFSAPTLVDCHY